MRLSELHPVFPFSGGTGVTDVHTGDVIDRTEGVGVIFDCPCGNKDEEHRLFVPFQNPIGPGPIVAQHGWRREGTTFEDLTLTPSILRREGCRWHGVVTKGEVITV